MERTRELPKNTQLSLQFIEILKSMGYELIVDDSKSIDYSDLDDVDIANFNNIIKGEDDNEDND
jgi:hypothetical protein